MFQAQTETKEYPPFAIFLAFVLALASILPIVVVAILRYENNYQLLILAYLLNTPMVRLFNDHKKSYRALKISKPEPTAYNKAPMTRVDTNASTLPMFPNVSIHIFIINKRLYSCMLLNVGSSY